MKKGKKKGKRSDSSRIETVMRFSLILGVLLLTIISATIVQAKCTCGNLGSGMWNACNVVPHRNHPHLSLETLIRLSLTISLLFWKLYRHFSRRDSKKSKDRESLIELWFKEILRCITKYSEDPNAIVTYRSSFISRRANSTFSKFYLSFNFKRRRSRLIKSD